MKIHLRTGRVTIWTRKIDGVTETDSFLFAAAEKASRPPPNQIESRGRRSTDRLAPSRHGRG